jgi:hypothetical protein
MTAKNTAEISQQAQIKVPAKDLLAVARNAQHFADLLIENHFWMEAIAYLSHAIPPREGIWWAWFCARKAAIPKGVAAEIQALTIAEAWIAQPVEENRKKAHADAERLAPGTAVQAVLQAIDYTGVHEQQIRSSIGA